MGNKKIILLFLCAFVKNAHSAFAARTTCVAQTMLRNAQRINKTHIIPFIKSRIVHLKQNRNYIWGLPGRKKASEINKRIKIATLIRFKQMEKKAIDFFRIEMKKEHKLIKCEKSRYKQQILKPKKPSRTIVKRKHFNLVRLLPKNMIAQVEKGITRVKEGVVKVKTVFRSMVIRVKVFCKRMLLRLIAARLAFSAARIAGEQIKKGWIGASGKLREKIINRMAQAFNKRFSRKFNQRASAAGAGATENKHNEKNEKKEQNSKQKIKIDFDNELIDSKIKDAIAEEMSTTKLHKASFEGNIDTVCKILKTKDGVKNINQQTSIHKFTPLHFAVMRGHIKIVKMLLDNGANVELKDNFKNNALHYAAGHKNKQKKKILVEMVMEGDNATIAVRAKGSNNKTAEELLK